MVKKNILIVVGTRPEAIKLLPIYNELKKSKVLSPILVSTGQHKEMLSQIFDFFGISPDVNLDVMLKNQSLVGLTSVLFEALGQLYSQFKIDAVLVQGDTTTAFTAATVAHYNQIPLGHVEAGLRTYDKWAPFPEEANRKMISVVADWHFTPTVRATEALTRENITEGLFQVGNTVVDSLFYAMARNQGHQATYDLKYKNIALGFKHIVLVTGHRRESFGEGFQEICAALKEISRKYPQVKLIYPVHLNPNVSEYVKLELGDCRNISLINPVPYGDMVFLMSKAWLVMTDSGGIQEEAPSLDVPVIVMRKTTERQEALAAGCAVLAGVDRHEIVRQFEHIANDEVCYNNMARAKNPFGDGHASTRIVKILEEKMTAQRLKVSTQ